MKSKFLLATAAVMALSFGLIHLPATAQTRTCTNLSDRASADSPELIRLQRHLQGQFERLTSGIGLAKRASVEARFQVDKTGHPVNLSILSATQDDPELTSAALGSIQAKSVYPEPLQWYRITFNFAPATPVAASPEPVTPQVKATKPCRTFTIDNNSLMGNRPAAQANPPQAFNPASASASNPAPATATPTARPTTTVSQAAAAPKSAVASKSTTPSKMTAPGPQASPQATGNPTADINAYYTELIANIKRKWMPTAAAREHRVAIQFTIGSDGSLKNAEVAKSSGNDQADQAALKAIQACAPFRHLPTNCPLSEVQGQFTFGKGGMIN